MKVTDKNQKGKTADHTRKQDTSVLNLGRFSIVIPFYNHEAGIENVVRECLLSGFPVIAVDDGSTDRSYERIRSIKGIQILRHRRNRGKGAALLTGMEAARGIADWVITLDADGQHLPSEIGQLVQSIKPGERKIVVGARTGMMSRDVPWSSQMGRRFSNFWVRLSGGPKISDSQSGFRIYPIPECIGIGVRSRRYQFEVEILARAAWNQIPVDEVPVHVVYETEKRISHFRPFIDFLRNSQVFTRLIFMRILIPAHRRKTLKVSGEP